MMEMIVAALRIGFPIDLVVKATLVLASAGLVALALHRASAATRHLVWTVSVVGLVVLPLLGLLLPAWEVPLSFVPPSAVESGSANGISESFVDFAPPLIGTAEQTTVADGTSLPPVPIVTAARSAPIRWGPLLFGVWAIGFGILLVRLLAGWWGISRLGRSAEPITDPKWQQSLKDAAWMLDVERPVFLVRSSKASMPMTWGTLRPTILVPAETEEWPEERRRVVLLHEMAHVARRDCFTQTLAELACTIYWFHPLTWVAARRLRTERERACDDRVLAAGERASDYAGHLLEVARAYRRQRGYGAAAIAMARPSQLEGRLLAVLDSARKRATPGRRATSIGIAAAALLLLPLSIVRAGEARQVGGDDSSSLHSQLQSALGLGEAGEEASATDLAIARLADSDLAMAIDTVIDLEIAAVHGGRIVLDLATGGNFRLVGWDRSAVSIHAELRGPDADDTIVDLASNDGTVVLSTEYRGTSRNRRGNHTFELRVPTSSNVEVASAGGSVTIEGISGDLSGRTGGGDVRLTRVAGRSTLGTGGGNITVTDATLDGEVTTGGGNVLIVNNVGSLQGRTGGGDVRIENSGSQAGTERAGVSPEVVSIRTGGGNIELLDLAGGADVSTGGGQIEIRSAQGPVSARTGGGEIWIGRALGPVQASTGGGDIEIGSAAGAVKLTTGGGDVSVAMTGGAGSHDVEITSGDGTITLDLPDDFSGEFDIRIETRDDEPESQLQSDFELAREIQSERRGSTVHATGRTGGGANRVIIRTSGGEVRIRRVPAGAAAAAGQSAPRRYVVAGSIRDSRGLDRIVEDAVQAGVAHGLDNLPIASFVSSMVSMSLDATREALEAATIALEQESAALEHEISSLEHASEGASAAVRALRFEVPVQVQKEVVVPPR